MKERVKDAVQKKNFTLCHLLDLVDEKGSDVDALLRYVAIPEAAQALRREDIIFAIFRCMTERPDDSEEADEVFGKYKRHYFCSEVALRFERDVFEIPHDPMHTIDKPKVFGYLSVLFNFMKQTGTLDEVVLVLFTKVPKRL